MTLFTPLNIVLLLVAGVFQVLGTCLIPMTKGMTQPVPTAITAVCFVVGISLIARLNYRGVNLAMLAPFFSATVPLIAVLVGVFYYGEPASAARLTLLILATVLVGVANMV